MSQDTHQVTLATSLPLIQLPKANPVEPFVLAKEVETLQIVRFEYLVDGPMSAMADPLLTQLRPKYWFVVYIYPIEELKGNTENTARVYKTSEDRLFFILGNRAVLLTEE